jgi:hypothetical protein
MAYANHFRPWWCAKGHVDLSEILQSKIRELNGRLVQSLALFRTRPNDDDNYGGGQAESDDGCGDGHASRPLPGIYGR